MCMPLGAQGSVVCFTAHGHRSAHPPAHLDISATQLSLCTPNYSTCSNTVRTSCTVDLFMLRINFNQVVCDMNMKLEYKTDLSNMLHWLCHCIIRHGMFDWPAALAISFIARGQSMAVHVATWSGLNLTKGLSQRISLVWWINKQTNKPVCWSSKHTLLRRDRLHISWLYIWVCT